jgi:hypothetical protein
MVTINYVLFLHGFTVALWNPNLFPPIFYHGGFYGGILGHVDGRRGQGPRPRGGGPGGQCDGTALGALCGNQLLAARRNKGRGHGLRGQLALYINSWTLKITQF